MERIQMTVLQINKELNQWRKDILKLFVNVFFEKNEKMST